jgi:hypothetical protein
VVVRGIQCNEEREKKKKNLRLGPALVNKIIKGKIKLELQSPAIPAYTCAGKRELERS